MMYAVKDDVADGDSFMFKSQVNPNTFYLMKRGEKSNHEKIFLISYCTCCHV